MPTVDYAYKCLTNRADVWYDNYGVDLTRAGLSNVHSVHVHMRPHHIGGPAARQT